MNLPECFNTTPRWHPGIRNTLGSAQGGRCFPRRIVWLSSRTTASLSGTGMSLIVTSRVSSTSKSNPAASMASLAVAGSSSRVPSRCQGTSPVYIIEGRLSVVASSCANSESPGMGELRSVPPCSLPLGRFCRRSLGSLRGDWAKQTTFKGD